MTVYDEIRQAVFRELHSQDGLWDVAACNPPDTAVWVGERLLTLPVGHAVLPRTDVVCVGESGRMLRVIHGTPSCAPLRPILPNGYVPLAYVHVPSCALVVLASMVEPLPVEAS